MSWPALAGPFGVVAVAATIGCEAPGVLPPTTSGNTSGAGAAAPQGVVSVASGPGVGGAEPAPEPCVPVPPRPDVPIPEGWEENLDWSPCCRFYVPTSADVLPSPLVWVPCDPPLGTSDCERLETPWPNSGWPVFPNTTFLDNRDPDHPVLFHRRFISAPGDGMLMDVAAEVDGPVRTAMLKVNYSHEDHFSPGCLFLPIGGYDGRFMIRASGNDETGLHQDPLTASGMLTGLYDDLRPTVLAKGDTSYGWRAGHDRLVRKKGATWTSRFDEGIETKITDESTIDPVIVGDAVYYLVGNGESNQALHMWTPELGESVLLSLNGDLTKSLFGLATDGTSLVWARGEGGVPGELGWTDRSLWTAPLTTDPQAFAPRRLGTAPYPHLHQKPLRAGCGYLVHEMPTSFFGAGIFVQRLSDGTAWALPDSADHSYLGDVTGLTCEHAYVFAGINGPDPGLTILRIRLDSLTDDLKISL